MKSVRIILVVCEPLSHPARGAWIEIVRGFDVGLLFRGRTPQGARGLKYPRTHGLLLPRTVAPRKGRVD